jgi:Spy/CpxP family protein refolding chaperone
MKKILLITLVLLAFSFVLFAQKTDKPEMEKGCPMSQKQDMKMGEGEMGNHQNMMKELDLTKEQLKKMEALRDEHMKYLNVKQAELENLRIDKQNAMKAEQFDKAKRANKSIADLQLFIENAMVDHKAAMMKELTPEQKAKMMEMKPQGMKGMKHGKGRGMKDGQCKDCKGGSCTGDSK